MGAKRGRVLVEFATLEDLERIYKLMVGGGSLSRAWATPDDGEWSFGPACA